MAEDYIKEHIIKDKTDDEKDLIDLKNFLKTLKTVQKVELNAYHTLGVYKWGELGFKYPLEGVRPANADDVARAKRILEI